MEAFLSRNIQKHKRNLKRDRKREDKPKKYSTNRVLVNV